MNNTQKKFKRYDYFKAEKMLLEAFELSKENYLHSFKQIAKNHKTHRKIYLYLARKYDLMELYTRIKYVLESNVSKLVMLGTIKQGKANLILSNFKRNG